MFGIPALASARKAVGFLLLPILFALVGLLAFAVTQLPAQAAQSQVWSATMTAAVSRTGEDTGFSNLSGTAEDFGSLTLASFDFEGTTYTVQRLIRDVEEKFLEFQADRDLPDGLLNVMTLALGDDSFAGGDAEIRPSTPKAYRWTDVGLSFVADEEVAVVLTRTVVPIAPTGLDPTIGDGQVNLSWDDPVDESITKYQYRQSADSGVSWSPDWSDIASSDKDTISHEVSGLDEHSEYTFAIRAVNDAGEGTASPDISVVIEPITLETVGPLTLQEGYSAQQVTFTTNYVPADYPEDELYRMLMVSYGGGADQYDIRYDRGENEPNVVDSSGALFAPSGRMLAYGVSETQSLRSPVSYWFRVLEDQKTESGEFITVQLAFGRGASLHLVEASRPVTLSLADAANRRPRFASSTKTYTINDDSPAGTKVGPVTFATDQENDTLTYSFAGTDDSHFEIDSLTGAITVKTTTLDWNNPADDDGDNDYEVILQVWDGKNGDGNPEADSDQPTQVDDYLDIIIRVTPAPTNVPAKTTGLTAIAEPDSMAFWVRLAWTDPSDPTVSHYQYQTNLGGGVYGEWENIPHSAPDQSNELDYRAPSIDFAVEHRFRIRAVNNLGPGEASDPATATPVWVPEAPMNFRAWPDDGRVILTWETPSDNGSVITGFMYSKDSGTYTEISNSDATTTHFALYGLDNGQEYYFRVHAVNDEGDGQEAHVFVTPNVPPLPKKPEGFTATPGDGQVHLTWDDPGDGTITTIEGLQEPSGVGWTPIPDSAFGGGNAMSYTVPSLDNGTAYTFKLRAVNAQGPGPESNSATATPMTLNAAPNFVDGPTTSRSVAENMPPGTSIGARISATDSDASDTIIYSISRNDDDAFVVDSGGQLSNTKTLNYEQKSSYSITLRVEDNDGASDTIEVSIAVTDVNDPPIFVDGDSTVRRVAENSAQGTQIGQPIVATDEDDVPRYAVHASSANDLRVFQFDFETGQFSVDLTPLDHESKTSYFLTVEAYDDDDAATFIDVTIEIIDVAEPPPAPGAPTISPAGEAGDTTLNVSWTVPDTTGRPDIIGYDVRFRSGSNQNWTIRSLAGNTTSGNISGLVPGAIYVMQVAAKNDEGVSPWSSPGTGSTNLPASEQQPPTTPEPTAPPTVAPTVPPTPPAPPPTAQEILTLFAENPEQAGEVVGKLADDDPEEAGRVISESAEEDEQAAGQIICSAVGGHSASMGRAVGHAAKVNAGSTSNALGTISDDGDCVSQLGSVIPVEPWLPEQPPPEGQDQTGQGTWQDVGSPAPVENLMARFFTPIEDAHTDITNLDEPPSGTEPLPPDNIPYAYVDIAHDNFTNEDIVTAHATISVEKEWLSSTQVHQWSVQLSRFDPATTAWIPTQSKRVGEDEEKVYYTVTVPGFSLWAIHGSTEPPALTFVEDNLQINRQPIGIGQFTVVSVDVTNTTDAPATYFANLWVDKQINHTSQILIGTGLTQTVSFPLSIDIAGAYQIRVGSQLSQQPLLVEDPAAPVTPVAQGDLATPTAAPPTVPPTIPAAPPVEPTPDIAPTIAPTIPPTPAPVASVPEPTSAPESEEAIVAQVPVIGSVEFSDPSPSPGDQVMVIVPITHLGSGESSFDLEIEVGGSIVGQQTVVVPPGETLRVEMPIVAPSDPSEVTVRVNGLAKQAAITPAASGNTGVIIGVVVAAVVILVIIVVIIAVIRRRR